MSDKDSTFSTHKEIHMTIYRCKHCKVQVLAKNDARPVLGKTHGKKCPRRRTLG